MNTRFRSLRLMADDLTGALDSAVAFNRIFGSLEISLERHDRESLVFDSGTRERSEAEAVARLSGLAPMLEAAPGRLNFFKVDSLLRGHAGAELAAILGRNSYDHVILVTALPAQGRVTRQGRQVLVGQDHVTGEHLGATLARHGCPVDLRQPGEIPAPGISLFDAETEADIDRIVSATLSLPGETLWVGTGGLAAALGRALPAKFTLPILLPGLPILGLIGTDHPVARAQLGAVSSLRISAGDLLDDKLRQIHFSLINRGSIFVTCDLPPNTPREAARHVIARSFAECLAHLPRPGTLFASGGETLRALLAPLGARSLRVEKEFLPGVPLSTLVGGHWNGLPILSKSGAFGAPNFLSTLVGALQPGRKASIA